jgi:hypothetical protein
VTLRSKFKVTVTSFLYDILHHVIIQINTKYEGTQS